MGLLVIGDVLIERLLVSGDGYDSYSHHVQQKAAESPLQSICRVGGGALTVSLLESGGGLEIDKHSALSGKIPDNFWKDDGIDPRNSIQNKRPLIARQTLGLRPAPFLFPDDRRKTLRVERLLSLEYIDLKESHDF